MRPRATVLVVDDELAIRRLLHSGLGRSDYRVIEAGTAREALSSVGIDKPDVVLLDLGLPDRDGLELIQAFRRSGAAVIVISARDATDEKVSALDLGADDYVSKPFDNEEVLARIRVALRHRLPPEVGTPVLRQGDVEIDLDARIVRKNGSEIHLTPKEYAFIAELAGSPGRVVTHARMLRSVWGKGHESDVEYLRVAARAVRLKLEDDPSQPSMILNEPGIGYRLICET